jgi:DNA-directed RNA polymerase subunit M/transcription elongation factor TFIIS
MKSIDAIKAAGLTIPDQRDATPSSLTRPGARAGQSCPSCGSERVTALAMTLTDGTPVTFCSCHACEHKIWSDASGALDFADVLTRTAKKK